MDLVELFESEKSDIVVAIDMDGVLADFSAMVEQILDKPRDQITTREMWDGINRYNKNVEPFFENLPVMDDALDLVRFVYNNFNNWYILTASGYTPKDAPEQKKRWISKVFGPMTEVVVVTRSSDKAKYATQNSILIDDRSQSIDPWVAAGGIGILHTSAKDSIEQLKKYIE